MIRLAHIIKEYENDFINKYGNRLLPSHFKALHAIKTCRSSNSPKMLVQCKDCSHQKLVPHSCGHRHCPHCQNFETQQWINKQLQKRVPTDYFMVTFTLPAQFRSLAWHNQRIIYNLLFESAWDTLKTFSVNDKKLGGIPGAIIVLHTNSRELVFHPHVHVIIPAATIDKDKKIWATKISKYLFNNKAIAKVFRAKMLDAIKRKGLKLPESYPAEWRVNSRNVGKGDKALIYLSRYLYRGVIREKDIISCNNRSVTFRYKNSKTKKVNYKTIPAVDFLWLVFQHVLPRRFRRARNYGFLHPNSKGLIKIIQWVYRLSPKNLNDKIKPQKQMICSCCGAVMNIIKTRIPPYFSVPDLEAT